MGRYNKWFLFAACFFSFLQDIVLIKHDCMLAWVDLVVVGPSRGREGKSDTAVQQTGVGRSREGEGFIYLILNLVWNEKVLPHHTSPFKHKGWYVPSGCFLISGVLRSKLNVTILLVDLSLSLAKLQQTVEVCCPKVKALKIKVQCLSENKKDMSVKAERNHFVSLQEWTWFLGIVQWSSAECLLPEAA